MTNDLGMLPAELRDKMQAELSAGERVTFCMQPDPSRCAWRSDLTADQSGHISLAIKAAAIVLPLFFLLLAGVRLLGSVSGDGEFHLPSRLIPMVCVLLPGLIVLIGTPLRLRRYARSVVYVVTTQRAMILRPARRAVRVDSFRPSQLGHITKTQRSDGSGDLTFNTESEFTGKYTLPKKVGFVALADVKSAEMAIQKLIVDAARGAQSM